jgi:hypothetical protein
MTFLDTGFATSSTVVGASSAWGSTWTATTGLTTTIDSATAGTAGAVVVLLYQLDNNGNNIKQVALPLWVAGSGSNINPSTSAKIQVNLVTSTIAVDFANANAASVLTANSANCANGYNLYFKEMQGGLTAVTK